MKLKFTTKAQASTLFGLLFLFLFIGSCHRQPQKLESINLKDPKSNWEILSSLQYKSYFNKENNEIISTPQYSNKIRQLQGHKIVLNGYITTYQGYTFLSLYPCSTISPRDNMHHCYDNCYSTLATSIEIDSILGNMLWNTKCTVEGIFRLNESDTNKLAYILEQPVINIE